jgi:hypothetical protein
MGCVSDNHPAAVSDGCNTFMERGGRCPSALPPPHQVRPSAWFGLVACFFIALIDGFCVWGCSMSLRCVWLVCLLHHVACAACGAQLQKCLGVCLH